MRVYYGPLLGHSKAFVRQFAAETFAALIRKLKVRSTPSSTLRMRVHSPDSPSLWHTAQAHALSRSARHQGARGRLRAGRRFGWRVRHAEL